jgi:hypothetical protein
MSLADWKWRWDQERLEVGLRRSMESFEELWMH